MDLAFDTEQDEFSAVFDINGKREGGEWCCVSIWIANAIKMVPETKKGKWETVSNTLSRKRENRYNCLNG